VSARQIGQVIEEDTRSADQSATAKDVVMDQQGTEPKATNLTWQQHRITKAERARRKGQKPCVLWFTGLSGSGKSTIANALEERLAEMGYHTYLLDGDNVRHGLNKDLGFSDADRTENIRRIGEAAKLFVDAGIIVLTAFISPFRSDRALVRAIVQADEFLEIFVDTPLFICEQRDPKGLYARARRGEIKNFTGLDSPYEPPDNPEVHLYPGRETIEQSVDRLVKGLEEWDVLPT
jgi:adenylyl-sulfate kinase